MSVVAIVRVLTGPHAGKQFDLSAGQSLSVGRKSDNDFPIADGYMSRQHFVIAVEGGSVSVRDAGSSHGTMVNGERIAQPTHLTNEDVVRAGVTDFSIEIVGADSDLGEPEPEPFRPGQTSIMSSVRPPSSKPDPSHQPAASTGSSRTGWDDMWSRSSQGSLWADKSSAQPVAPPADGGEPDRPAAGGAGENRGKPPARGRDNAVTRPPQPHGQEDEGRRARPPRPVQQQPLPDVTMDPGDDFGLPESGTLRNVASRPAPESDRSERVGPLSPVPEPEPEPPAPVRSSGSDDQQGDLPPPPHSSTRSKAPAPEQPAKPVDDAFWDDVPEPEPTPRREERKAEPPPAEPEPPPAEPEPDVDWWDD